MKEIKAVNKKAAPTLVVAHHAESSKELAVEERLEQFA